MTAILFYAPIIFQKAGFGQASDALFRTVLLNLFALVCNVAFLALVDRVGRRPLLLIGTAGLAVSEIFLGICFHINLTGLYVIAAMFLCNIFYQMGLAPLAWLILSEIFPIRVRAAGQAAGSLVVWASIFLSLQILPPLIGVLERSFGSAAGAFWVFSLICILALIFSWKMVPETKGRSLEEIAKFWTDRKALVPGS